MKVFRLVAALACVGLIMMLVSKAGSITEFAVADGQLGWFSSYLLPLGMLSFFLALLVGLLVPFVDQARHIKGMMMLVVICLTYATYFLVNRSSPADWIATGTDMTIVTESNPVQDFLNSEQPGFNGLFCFAMPGCSHCEMALPRLEVLKDRSPKMDVMIFVFATDTVEFQEYERLTALRNVLYTMVPEPMAAIALCEGSFPSFFYFKDGKISYRWLNEQFGFQALDRVEATFHRDLCSVH